MPHIRLKCVWIPCVGGVRFMKITASRILKDLRICSALCSLLSALCSLLSSLCSLLSALCSLLLNFFSEGLFLHFQYPSHSKSLLLFCSSPLYKLSDFGCFSRGWPATICNGTISKRLLGNLTTPHFSFFIHSRLNGHSVFQNIHRSTDMKSRKTYHTGTPLLSSNLQKPIVYCVNLSQILLLPREANQ